MLIGADGEFGGDSSRLQKKLDEGERNKPLLCTKWRGGSLIIIIRRSADSFCKCESYFDVFSLETTKMQRLPWNLSFSFLPHGKILDIIKHPSWSVDTLKCIWSIFCPYHEDFDIVLILKSGTLDIVFGVVLKWFNFTKYIFPSLQFTKFINNFFLCVFYLFCIYTSWSAVLCDISYFQFSRSSFSLWSMFKLSS